MIANVVLLAGMSLAWAFGYLFVSDADGRQVPPITASAVMALVAALVLVTAVVAMRRPLIGTVRKRTWVPLIMGLAGVALPNLSVVFAEQSVEAGLAAVIGTTVPILTLLLTTFVTRQLAYSSWHILGVAVAVAGLIVFVGWNALISNKAQLTDMLVMMAGGLVFALNGIFVSYEAKNADEYALAAWTMVFAAMMLTAAAFVFEAPLATLKPDDLAPLVAEGAIGMAFAYLGYFALVARSGPYFASLYAFLVPPFGVLAAALVFGEALTSRRLLGVSIVLLGLVLMQLSGRWAAPAAEQKAAVAG